MIITTSPLDMQRKADILKRIFDILKSNPLFSEVAYCDFVKMLDCLSAKTANYSKGAVILLSGNTVNFVGLILSGSVRVIKEDANGYPSIIAELGVSEIFGEAFA